MSVWKVELETYRRIDVMYQSSAMMSDTVPVCSSEELSMKSNCQSMFLHSPYG